MPSSKDDFNSVLAAAIDDMVEHGFDSVERVQRWTEALRTAAARSMISATTLDQQLRDAMTAIYRKMVENGEIARFHPGIARFTLERVKPTLRAELDRRIYANASLIKLNREEAVEKTLRRFQGWSTSIPVGGTGQADKRDTKKTVKKALGSLPFEERRVIIDQSHKLQSALSNILARDGGAIAGIWHSRWRQPGYDYRPDHKDRDQRTYAIRGCWAIERGLMRKGPNGYYDEMTAVGEEPFCRCTMQYLYSLGQLPRDMLTKRGESELERVRAALAS